MRKVICDWTPGKGVGVIELSAPIKNLLRDGYLRPEPHEPPWDEFESFEDSEGRLSVDLDEEGLVESILCDETLFFKGHELIGRSEAEILDILGPPEEIDEVEIMLDGDEQTPWRYESLGLTISFQDKLSVVAIVDDPQIV